MTSENVADNGLLLSGLDGGNLLGFLAAIGTLQVVNFHNPSTEWRLGWVQSGKWTPALFGDDTITQGELVEILSLNLDAIEDNKAFEFAKNLSVAPDEFRKVAQDSQRCATSQDRRRADFIAAFGCEAATSRDKKKIQDTALRTMNGSGHQHFLGSMKELADKTGRDHLHEALFALWQYWDSTPYLRWDPVDDRRYALRWGNPGDTSKNPIRTVRGANRLAVEALPLLPTAPSESELQTTGVSRQDRRVFFTWPIWESPIDVNVVRSLLSMAELQKPEPNRVHLRNMGIVAVYRSERITTGRFRNFTPSHTV